MILPDASVDLSVQLGALASGERKFAYFPGRDRSDIPFGFAFVEVAGVEQGVPERGVAVFRDRADIQDYLGEVSSEGLTAANARWLGYLSGGKPSGCVCVMASVLRDGGVVHDELVPAGAAARRAEIVLRARFPRDSVVLQPVEQALRDRVSRYSRRDLERFPEAVELAASFTGD